MQYLLVIKCTLIVFIEFKSFSQLLQYRFVAYCEKQILWGAVCKNIFKTPRF